MTDDRIALRELLETGTGYTIRVAAADDFSAVARIFSAVTNS